MSASAWTPIDETAAQWKPVTEKAGAASAAKDSSGFFANLGGDLANAAKGVAHLFDQPQDTVEQALSAQPGAVQAYRALRGYYHATRQSIERAEQAGEKNDKTGVVINSAAAGLPLVGPLVGGVYEAAKDKTPLGAAGVGASRILQAASMAPEGSVIPNPVSMAAKGVTGAVRAAPTLAREAVPALGKVAETLSDVVSPEITGMVSPRLANAQRFLGKLAKAIKARQAAAPAETPAAAAAEGEYVDVEPLRDAAAEEAARVPRAPSQVVYPKALPEAASAARDLPYRRGPGSVAPEDVSAPDARVLAGRKGVRTTPAGLLEAGSEEAAAAPEAAKPAEASYLPRTRAGESVLSDTLAALPNKRLLQIARARGVNVTAEAQLKPGIADNRIIKKILDDYSPDELADIRDIGIEMGRHRLELGAFSKQGYEMIKMQTFFPELKLSQADMARFAAEQKFLAAKRNGPQVPTSDADLTDLLEASVARAKR